MLIALCILTGTVAALSLPQVVSLSRPAGTDLVPVASFEGGQRFSAGPYPVIVLSGSYRQRNGTGVIAAANHFADPAWNFSAAPAEHSVSRYNNLLRQAGEAKGSIDARKMMEIRDVCLENGGATFCHSALYGNTYSTNHQVVFMPETKTLWMKVADKNWQKVELVPLFGN